MQILLSSDDSSGVADVQNWLDFNEMHYQYHQLYHQSDSLFHIDRDLENSILVCNQNILRHLVHQQRDKWALVNDLARFSQKNNVLWVVGQDMTEGLLRSNMREFLIDVDSKISKSSMVLFLDAQPTDSCFLTHLHNVHCCVMKINFCGRELPRCQGPTATKTVVGHDYLLTMMLKKFRPHRNQLWHQLQQRPELANRGLLIVNRSSEMGNDWSKWKGSTPSNLATCMFSLASMDWYLNCWLEIVPESNYRDLYMMTEKIIKPIKTRTPFLMVATAGYLSWLRQQGFQTFESLIDERYDQHHRVEDRIAHMLDVLQDIISNGTEDFYRASRPILDHNFSRLCEMSGSWNVQFDDMMWQALEAAQSK